MGEMPGWKNREVIRENLYGQEIRNAWFDEDGNLVIDFYTGDRLIAQQTRLILAQAGRTTVS